MDKLEKRASEYAEHTLDTWKKEKAIGIKRLIAEAYEQGWVDRDTRDMKPEAEEAFLTENRI